MIQENKKSGL